MVADILNKARVLINASKNNEAQKILEPYIEANPQNIQAWLLEVETWPNLDAKIQVLDMCLRHNPQAAPAQQMLAALKAQMPAKIIPPASSLSTRSRLNGTKFLDTAGISYYLQHLINQAQDTLILISPYLQINERLRQALTDKDRMKLGFRLVYGKHDLQPEQANWLKSLKCVRANYCKNLHAKCYLNETEAIVTSMNLYDFSQSNNQEMGIYIARAGDAELYSDIYNEAWRLIRISEEVSFSTQNPPTTAVRPTNSGHGYCMRCKKEIALNPDAPYCVECFMVWNRYKNFNYQEKYCHQCGKEHSTTRNKPVCYACYQQSREKSPKG